jgi:sulfatase modifying factor 1
MCVEGGVGRGAGVSLRRGGASQGARAVAWARAVLGLLCGVGLLCGAGEVCGGVGLGSAWAQGAEDRVFVEQSWQALFRRRFDTAKDQAERAAVVLEFKAFLSKKGRSLSASPQLSRQLSGSSRSRPARAAAEASASPQGGRSSGHQGTRGRLRDQRIQRGPLNQSGPRSSRGLSSPSSPSGPSGPSGPSDASDGTDASRALDAIEGAPSGAARARASVVVLVPMDTVEFERLAQQWFHEGVREAALKSGVAWVRVPGGVRPVGVGSAPSLEGPSRAVELEGFWVMSAEVTVEQYGRCVAQRACTLEGVTAFAGCNWGRAGRERHPMNCVTWHQARRFARWVGGDLPSEAEWEFAARALGVSELLDDVVQGAWTEESASETQRVASRPASEGGVYDMLGNVWEWALDEFSLTLEGAPQSGRARCVERGCAVVNGLPRAMRGGGWYDTAVNLRLTTRAGSPPDHRDDGVGFRVVRGR